MIRLLTKNNFLSFGANKVSRNNSNTSVLKNAPNRDVFEHSYKPAFLGSFHSTNPNAQFLYNSELSYDEKLKMLDERPEIEDVSKIERDNNFSPNSFRLNKYFVVDKLQNCRQHVRYFIDSSVELNRRNLERIAENKDNLFTFDEYRKTYGTSPSALLQQENGGRVRPFELYSKKTGNLEPSPLVYVQGNNPKASAKNVLRIGQRTKYFDKIIDFSCKAVPANILSLSKLGFGDPKTLYSLVKSGKIDGKISSTVVDGKEKTIVCADLLSRKTASVLKNLRDRQCMELSIADNRFGLTKQELLNAFNSGDLDCYTDAVFIGDLGKIFIDMNSEKNHATFNRMLFEKEILNGFNPDKLKKCATNQRIKIAWYLAPKTRQTAQELLDNSPKIQELLDSIERREISRSYEDYKGFPFAESGEPDDAELLDLREFCDKLWDKAGFEEYENALSMADTVLNKISTDGIDSIADSELKDVICCSQYKATNDFRRFAKS